MKARLAQKISKAMLLGVFLVFSTGLKAEPSVTVEQKEPSVTVVPRALKISPSISELLKLHRGGVDDAIVLAFVDAYPQPFGLTGDDILYMQDEGVTNSVVMAILKHDARMLEQFAAFQGPLDPGADTSDAGAVEYAPTYVENPPEEVATFYNDLAPYGSWLYLEDQGWCWQPNAAAGDASWAPYLDNGKWLYSDAGWYWDSGYSWGWAPFHYGRWSNASCGWVWFPDTVWAPSWCSWRFSDHYCGWAPTGPSFFPGRYGLGFRHFGHGERSKSGPDAYTFVGYDHMFDHNLRPYRMGRSEARGIYDRTLPGVAPFARGDIIVNQGAPISRFGQGSGKRVPTLPISTVRVDPKSTRPGVQKSGGSDVITLPKLTTPTRFNGMVAQRVNPNPTGSVSTFRTRGAPIQEGAGAGAADPPAVFPYSGPSHRGSGFDSPGQEFGPGGGFGPGQGFGPGRGDFAPGGGGIELTPQAPQGYAPGPTPQLPVTTPALSAPPVGAQSQTPSIPGSPSFSPHQSYVPRQSFHGGTGYGGGSHNGGGTPGNGNPPGGRYGGSSGQPGGGGGGSGHGGHSSGAGAPPAGAPGGGGGTANR